MQDPIAAAADAALRLSLLAQRDALAAAVARARSVMDDAPSVQMEEWDGPAERAQELLARHLLGTFARAADAIDDALAATSQALAVLDER
jgi:hypothetical protein